MSRAEAMSLTMNEESILECLADGVMVLDREWCLTYLNHRQAKWFSLSKEEVFGKTIWEVCPEWAASEMQQQLQQIVTSQSSGQLEYYCLKRQGWFELRICPSDTKITILTIDITQRKQKEDALRQSELRFQAFMNHSPASTWIANKAGYLLYLNPFYLKTFSCAPDAIGQHISEIFAPETAQQFLRNNQHVFETGQALQTVEYVPDIDGSVKSFLVCKFPIFDESEEQLLGGFAVDISKQKQTEATLREREQHLKIALRTARLGSWQHDLTTNVLTCSDQCKANFGLPADAEFTHETLLAILHPDDRDRVKAAIQRSIEERIDYEVEERCFHPDGSLHWLIARGGLICDEDGHPIRLVGVTLDITERKQYEESLKAANQRVSNILESITDAFIAFDQDWRYTYINQEAARLLKKKPEELLGKQWQDIFSDSTHTVFTEQFAKVMTDRVTAHCEGFSPTMNRWLEASIFPATPGISVFFRDISNRKQEEQRKALQYRMSQLLAEATTLVDIAPILLQTLCEALGWQVGAIWSVDPTGSFLHYTNSWAAPEIDAHPFIRVSQQTTFAKGIGLPGRIWSYRQPTWIANLSEDDHFLRTTAASKAGLQAGFGFPILLGEDCFGIIECLSDRPQAPDADLLQLMVAIGRQIGQFMERKRTELALRESEELFQSFMNHSPVAAFIKDESGQYVYVNALIEQLLDRPAHELIGHTDFDWLPREAIEQIRTNDATVLSKNEPLQFLETVPIGEQVRYFIAFKFPLRDVCGKQLIGGVSVDITERKQQEEDLRAGKERLSLALTAAKMGDWGWDAATDVVIFSQQAYKIFGIQPGSHLTWTQLQQQIIEEDRERARVAVERAAQEHIDYDIEYRITTANGTQRWIAAKGRAQYNSSGHVLGMLGVVQNITARKQAEAEREQLLEREKAAREQAETANRLKDEFLAVLSHELRSPLNPILGWTQLLRSRQLDSKTSDRALEIIERNAKLQTQLIEDLLDVSRILQGKLLLNIQPIHLATVIESALETVRLAAEAKGITLQKQLPDTTVYIAGDAGRLQQVMWNLLSNAVKFTPSGGQVEVKLESYEFSVMGSQLTNSPQSLKLKTQHSKSYAQITVTDTGKGISPEFLPHVFDYFRQEDSTTTRQFGGLGLGLAIVRYLTELHGGTVSVESAGENLGTTFTVRVPLLERQKTTIENKEDQENASSATPHFPLTGIRVLAVDDEPDMRELLATILSGSGAEVKVLSSAQAVLAAIDGSVPDILISDIGMPEMDGYRLMQQIRAKPAEEGGNVVAIALTAYAGEMNQQQAMAAGFQQHISKPVEPENLVNAIVSLLGVEAKDSNL